MRLAHFNGFHFEPGYTYIVGEDVPLEIPAHDEHVVELFNCRIDGHQVPDGRYKFYEGEPITVVGTVRLIRRQSDSKLTGGGEVWEGVNAPNNMEDPNYTEFKKMAARLGLILPEVIDQHQAPLDLEQEEDDDPDDFAIDPPEHDEDVDHEEPPADATPAEATPGTLEASEEPPEADRDADSPSSEDQPTDA